MAGTLKAYALNGYPFTVTMAVASPAGTTDTVACHITNTGYQPMQVAGCTTNQALLSPGAGTTIATGESALSEIASGSSVQVAFNPIGVSHEALVL